MKKQSQLCFEINQSSGLILYAYFLASIFLLMLIFWPQAWWAKCSIIFFLFVFSKVLIRHIFVLPFQSIQRLKCVDDVWTLDCKQPQRKAIDIRFRENTRVFGAWVLLSFKEVETKKHWFLMLDQHSMRREEWCCLRRCLLLRPQIFFDGREQEDLRHL